jgi:anionic cell wall polymer biosynthesis LytR-Cps2A-Psr (LCP) family protein
VRAQRRRQQRRRVGAAGVAGILIAAIVVAVAVGFGVHEATKHTSAPTRTQTTVLLSITGADGTAVESALLAHDSTSKSGVELLLPTRVISEVCGFGSQQLGRIITLPDGERLSRVAVSELLGGVTVDGSWTITSTQFARLVDEVGGVTVDVDANVIRTIGKRRVLFVRSGAGQHLNGNQALAYATYIAPREDSTGNLARLQTVFEGILAKLPASTTRIAQLTSALGPKAGSTIGSQPLAALLLGLAGDVRTNNAFPSVLPVVKIDSGGASPSFRVDEPQTKTLVDTNLAESLPAGARAARPRVLIQNGVGTPGLAGSACKRLVAAGFRVVGSGNADNFDFRTSKVLVFSSSVASAELGGRVAHALGVSANDVAVSSQPQNVADVIVILGKDFHS